MTVSHWSDDNAIGKRLATRRLAGLLSIDLEGKESIGAIGAIRTDRSSSYVWQGKGKGMPAALAALDEFADGASYLVGHNIIEHDLKLLARHAPDLKLLSVPTIDTLYLSPLAFPENPYHHLVKQYQEPALARVQINDPFLDAELTLELLADIVDALESKDSDLLLAWHALLSTGIEGHAFDQLFRTIRESDATPLVEEAIPGIARRLGERGCPNRAAEIARDALSHPLPLTYLLAWLPAAGGNSIIPPYVEMRFEPSRLATKLRDSHCGKRDCAWCSERLDPERALKRFFGFPSFRHKPQSSDGESLQRSITVRHLARAHVLGILPTGAGKSLCYQLPALMRYEASGALTVVISPLVALMADQVAAMRRQGIACATTINGLISMPERADALDQIRFGDAGIVLVAPEQLRNPSFRKAIAGRRIGAWVLDEAHCLSKWGHDFRPDYRYVARYIAEHGGDEPAPILCLTATAKYDVVEEIQMTRACQTLTLVQVADARATNLRDEPLAATANERAEHLLQPLEKSPSLIERKAPSPDLSDRRLDERLMVCAMEDVVLSFAGWRSKASETHRAIASLKPGDPLSLVREGDHWELLDAKQRPVGRMARKWAVPKGMTIAQTAVHGIFVWRAEDANDEEHKKHLCSDTWEVVVPRFVLFPERSQVLRVAEGA